MQDPYWAIFGKARLGSQFRSAMQPLNPPEPRHPASKLRIFPLRSNLSAAAALDVAAGPYALAASLDTRSTGFRAEIHVQVWKHGEGQRSQVWKSPLLSLRLVNNIVEQLPQNVAGQAG